MKITKAVIPAAGLGTRVLPASKAVPKEMLPIVDKPAIQYIVEEAVAAGITDILIITGRDKDAIENHFDRDPELEARLLKDNKLELYDAAVAPANLANIYFIRQKETKGLGHAVLCAKEFIGDEPFVVLYGDDVILGETSATKELCDEFYRSHRPVLGVKQVPLKDIGRYSSVKIEDGNTVTDMIEKPNPSQVLSNYSILGRVILTPEIFTVLQETPAGAGGEIQLTDAMKTLCHRTPFSAVEYSGKRYDMGNKLGILEAQLDAALMREDLREDVLELLKQKLK